MMYRIAYTVTDDDFFHICLTKMADLSAQFWILNKQADT